MPLLTIHTKPLRGIWKIEETSDELFSLLERGEEYRPELEHIRMEHRRQEWLAVRVLLQQMTGGFTRIAYLPTGAPYLPDSPLHISISHTKGYVAVLLQEQPAAGIDIEYRSVRVLKIRSRFMNPDEESSLDPANELEHLLIYWCAKETLFKMIGQEEVDFRKHLHIGPFRFSERGACAAYETRTVNCRNYKLEYQVLPDFIWVWSLV